MRARAAGAATRSSARAARCRARMDWLGCRRQVGEVLLEPVQLAPRAGADGDAPADRAAHRAHHVQVVRVAVAGETGAVRLVLRRLGELGALQVGQRQVVEEAARMNSSLEVKTKSSSPSPESLAWPLPDPPAPPLGRAMRSPAHVVPVAGWTISRWPPLPWPNTGSAMSLFECGCPRRSRCRGCRARPRRVGPPRGSAPCAGAGTARGCRWTCSCPPAAGR